MGSVFRIITLVPRRRKFKQFRKMVADVTGRLEVHSSSSSHKLSFASLQLLLHGNKGRDMNEGPSTIFFTQNTIYGSVIHQNYGSVTHQGSNIVEQGPFLDDNHSLTDHGQLHNDHNQSSVRVANANHGVANEAYGEYPICLYTGFRILSTQAKDRPSYARGDTSSITQIRRPVVSALLESIARRLTDEHMDLNPKTIQVAMKCMLLLLHLRMTKVMIRALEPVMTTKVPHLSKVCFSYFSWIDALTCICKSNTNPEAQNRRRRICWTFNCLDPGYPGASICAVFLTYTSECISGSIPSRYIIGTGLYFLGGQ